MNVLRLITLSSVSDYLDRRFDRVARLSDGTINDAALERTGFRWAVQELQDWLGVEKNTAQHLVKRVGWY